MANPAASIPIPPGQLFQLCQSELPHHDGQRFEAATGERFDKLVAKNVLAPLKIDACFKLG